MHAPTLEAKGVLMAAKAEDPPRPQGRWGMGRGEELTCQMAPAATMEFRNSSGGCILQAMVHMIRLGRQAPAKPKESQRT